MGFLSQFFSMKRELAIDLGTANTIIMADDEIVVNEPSVVAIDPNTGKTIAVGENAKLMYEKTNDKIKVVRPLHDGVIADFNACEQMMRGLINMVRTRRHLFTPSIRMVIGVPSGSTEVELRAVRDSAEHAGGRDVYLIFEPMAAAIGIGLDVNAPEGNMVVDIGGGTTEIAIISMGGIVSNNSIKMAGDDFTSDIQEYMSRQHNILVSERMAERIKINVGSALAELSPEQAPQRLRCTWSQPHYGTAHGSACGISRNSPLFGAFHCAYRSRNFECFVQYTSRIVCRHCEKWYISYRGGSIAAWFRQTFDQENQHYFPRCGRTFALCGTWHRKGTGQC